MINSSCYASSKTCSELLNECVTVVHESDAFLALKDSHIVLLREQNEGLQTALNSEIERATHAEVWYRDPKLVAPTLFILGFITAIHAERH